MSTKSWHIIGYILYGIAILDFGLALLGADITGVNWSPLLFGALGYCCFFYTKEPALAEGEELLVLGDGKKANATITIVKDLEGKSIKADDRSHKLFLTTQTLQIDGPKVNVIWPYSSIQSVSQDTGPMKLKALRLVTHDNQDLKLNIGGKKRDLFMAVIEAKSAEAPEVASPPAEASGGAAPSAEAAAPPPLPDGDSDQTG